jgi:GT2 family glycosyltransferase
MRKFTVSVIIPIFNSEKLLEKNIPALIRASNYTDNNILEIIIVDDGSRDESVNFLKKNYPKIRLFKHKINRGLPAAINTGVRAAKGNLVLLIHADVVPEKDFLIPIFKHFNNDNVFAVSSYVNKSGISKGSFSSGFIKLFIAEGTSEFANSFYVSDGCGVFRRDIWMELNGMDEKLYSPFHWEDVDICYRAEKRGYINIWEPDSHVVHNRESNKDKFPKNYVQKIRERNQLLLIWKNIHSPTLMRRHFIGILRKILRHPGYFSVIFMALMKIEITLRERKKEIKASKVSDEAIFSRFSDN